MIIHVETRGGTRWINTSRIVMIKPDDEDADQTVIVLANGQGLVITAQERCADIVKRCQEV